MMEDKHMYLRYISYKICIYAEIVNNCRIKVCLYFKNRDVYFNMSNLISVHSIW